MSEDIPFGEWIKNNPIGSAIALFLTFVLLIWISTPSTSPFGTNSTITTSMNTLYVNIQWLQWIFYPMLPFVIVYGFTQLPEPQKMDIRLKIDGIRGRTRLRPAESIMDQPQEESGEEE